MSHLDPIKVILTAAGAPGASTLIRYLQGIAERQVRVVGVDANAECIGTFLADEFCQIPMATDPQYPSALLSVAIDKNVDCVIISSSYEVEHISPHVASFESNGIKVLVSSPESLKTANNKKLLYEMFEHDDIVKIPKFKVVHSIDEFVKACDQLGFPNQKLCFKPSVSKGSRGFRYLSHNISRRDLLLNYKPDSKFISIEEMVEIFKDDPDFPELLIMETLSGEEIDSMVLADKGDALLITHKTREKNRGGVITLGQHVERPNLERAIRQILKKIPLSYNLGFQFMDEHLVEINPRLSTFLYTQDWVEPYFAVKLALGEMNQNDIRSLSKHIPKKLRMIRYFDQHFYIQ